jgi:uncharacterized protein YbjT (DUF2867 family)
MNTGTKTPVVLITDATVSTGTNTITRLLELNVPVRALVHKVDERSEKLGIQGVQTVQGDLSDIEAIGGVEGNRWCPTCRQVESNCTT